jgi:hypothetical protein
MTDQQLIPVMLDPKDVASLRGHASKIRTNLKYRVMNACEQALANPSVTVESNIFENALKERYVDIRPVGTTFPLGPCLVTITPKGGQDE